MIEVETARQKSVSYQSRMGVAYGVWRLAVERHNPQRSGQVVEEILGRIKVG